MNSVPLIFIAAEVVAFDGEKLIYPAAVLVALLGSIVAWLLMFGYSEVARRAS